MYPATGSLAVFRPSPWFVEVDSNLIGDWESEQGYSRFNLDQIFPKIKNLFLYYFLITTFK